MSDGKTLHVWADIGRQLTRWGTTTAESREDLIRGMKDEKKIKCLLAALVETVAQEDFKLAARYLANRQRDWEWKRRQQAEAIFERVKSDLEAKHGPCPARVYRKAWEGYLHHARWFAHEDCVFPPEVLDSMARDRFKLGWMGKKTKTRQAAEAWLKAKK